MNPAEKRALQAELQGKGYLVGGVTGWPVRATYYKKDGEALPNLPADPESMKKYMARGFSLTRPAPAPVVVPAPVGVAEPVGENNPLTCSVCGVTAKSPLGLNIHSTTHAKEKANVIS